MFIKYWNFTKEDIKTNVSYGMESSDDIGVIFRSLHCIPVVHNDVSVWKHQETITKEMLSFLRSESFICYQPRKIVLAEFQFQQRILVFACPMVNTLDQQTITCEFQFHWVPKTSGIYPQLS